MKKVRVLIALLVSSVLNSSSFATPQTMPLSRSFFDLLDNTQSQNDVPAGCKRDVIKVHDNVTQLQLDIAFANYRLYNPRTGAMDNVHLRSYNGCPTGPVVNIQPGDTLRVDLRNHLPAETESTCPNAPDPSKAHCFNTTNLHTHGLHVSPSGKSDNVLLKIPLQKHFHYQFDLPRTHPAGTFWYHAHRHGSTAIQAASGMEGVLIVRGNRSVRDRAINGGIADIDTLLKDCAGRPLKEHVFLFQQIEYGCFDNPAATAPIADPKTFE